MNDDSGEIEHVRIEFKAKNNRLLAERERRGLTQLEMAEELGVRQDQYGMAERFQKASKHVLEKIAFELRIDPADLFPEWAQSYGFALNAGKKYFLVSDDIAQELIETRSDPTMLKLLKESFDTDLDDVLKTVSEREAQIVRAYFGINQPRRSLEEIGDELKLPRERVRQIKEVVLRRLRHSTQAKKIKQYLGEEF